MYLSELIERLDRLDHATVFPHGFYEPHSYRGDYSQLAFVPKSDVSVADMLASAREARGKTYTGWKGGEFTMGDYTDVYLAQIGDCGEQLTAQFFDQLELVRLRAENTKLAAEVERLNKQCPCWCHSETQRADLRELLDAAEKERDEAIATLTEVKTERDTQWTLANRFRAGLKKIKAERDRLAAALRGIAEFSTGGIPSREARIAAAALKGEGK